MMSLNEADMTQIIIMGVNDTNTTEADKDGAETEEVFDYLKVYNIMFLYIAPTFILSGIISNTLAVAVMHSRFFRKAPSSFIMSALAMVDSGVLLTGLLRHWILALTDSWLDVRALSTTSCKIHFYFTYFLPQVSSWTLVLLTLERLASVTLPFKAKEIFSRQRMIIGWVVTVILISAFNVHFFKTMTLNGMKYVDDNNKTQQYSYCAPKQEDKHFVRHVWPWIDLALIAFIPLLIICTSNIVIVILLKRADRLRKTKMQTRADRDSRSITTMLVAISITFLVTTTPVSIYFIGRPYWPQDTTRDHFNMNVAYSVCNLGYYLSNCTNFYLYCLTGSKFRKALVAVMCCAKDSKKLTSQLSITTHVKGNDVMQGSINEDDDCASVQTTTTSQVNIYTVV